MNVTNTEHSDTGAAGQNRDKLIQGVHTHRQQLNPEEADRLWNPETG